MTLCVVCNTQQAIVNSDGDNIAFDEVRAPGLGGGNTMDDRVVECSKPGAVCPPVAHTMSSRLLNLAPTILQWWYDRATPADSFILGPSGYGYIYPARMAAEDQAAFANATVQAAAALGMEGYGEKEKKITENHRWGTPIPPRGGVGAPSVFSQGDSLLLSIYADGRSSDDVVAF